MHYLTWTGPLNPLAFETHDQVFLIPPIPLSSKRLQQVRGFWIDAGLENVYKDTKAVLSPTLDTKLYSQCPELVCLEFCLPRGRLFCSVDLVRCSGHSREAWRLLYIQSHTEGNSRSSRMKEVAAW